ncbi:RNI-like protein [Lichtheimia hyalospora FSU 10163]|nr:RNI-like protein [Lichtheimia hyalospora FSU 10163]
MSRQVLLLLLVLAQGLWWSAAQFNSQCQELRNSFLGLDNTTTSTPCCNETTSPDFYAECNSQGSITVLSFNGAKTDHTCDNATASLFNNLNELQNLTLDYYIDAARCPEVFSPTTYNNLTHLRTLSLRGSQLSSNISVSTANTSNNTIETLDLSYSSTTTNSSLQWLNLVFPQVKHLTWLSDSPMPKMQLTCMSFTNLTLNAVPSQDIIQWITNCTQLEHLDLRLTIEEQYDIDISTWLQPISTSLDALHYLSVIVDNPTASNIISSFPSWLNHLNNLTSIIYRAQVKDNIPANVLETLSLTTLDMHGNRLYGDLPGSLSSTQLQVIDLSENELSGTIPPMLGNTTSCNLDGNPILCSGIGNSWSLCQHCNLVPGFLGVMLRYKIQWIVILACLGVVLIGWIFIAFRKHQQTSFLVWVGVFYSLFSFINLLTTLVHLGMNVSLYTTTFSIMLATTVLYLAINCLLYRYCCRRFSILVIRRTWPVFLLCCLDMNNFGLYEIRMLNLSAYRKQIDLRVPVVLSWQKVIVADIAHTAIAIFLIMLHSPVASVLLTCITSGLGMVRAIVQVCLIWYHARKERKFHPIDRVPAHPKTIHGNDTPSTSTVHRPELELAQLINSREIAS